MSSRASISCIIEVHTSIKQYRSIKPLNFAPLLSISIFGLAKIHGLKLQLLLYRPKRANAKPLPSKAILTSKKSQYTMSYIPEVSKQAGQAMDVGWRVLNGVFGRFPPGMPKNTLCL